MENLKIGIKPSLKTVKIQLQLRALDFFNQDIDGKFDNFLEVSVKRFQKKLGLVVDGIAGAYTQAKLSQLTKDRLLILFIHCAASPEGQYFTGHQVELMHTLPVAKGGRGWSRAGYSDVLRLDGIIDNIREWNQDDLISDWEYTFGVKFSTLLNRNARHFCYIGGVEKRTYNPKDTRTGAQLEAMETYIKFNILRNPKIVIAGHNQAQSDKFAGCPSFEVPEYLRSIEIADYNIAKWGKLSN